MLFRSRIDLVRSCVSPVYFSGNGGITGAGLPPKPVTTSAVADAPDPVLLPKPVVGAVTGALPKPLPVPTVEDPKLGVTAAGAVVVGGCSPPLLAPPNFS